MPNPDPNSFESLFDALKAQLNNNEQHPLLQALNEVNRYITNLRQPDRYKRVPYVTAENKQELIRLHQKVAEESEKLLKSTQNNDVRKVMEKITALASGNFNSISAYDPTGKPKSIDTIEEETRALHLYFGKKPEEGTFHQVGKTLSKREFIRFMDEKGHEVSGVFTAKTKDAVYATIDHEMMGNYSEKAKRREGELMLYGLLTDAKNQETRQKGAILDSRDYDALHELMSNISVYDPKTQGYVVKDEKLTDYLVKLNPKYSKAQIINLVGSDLLVQVSEFLTRYATQVMANMGEAGISDDSRIDTRNAAMSAAADLFGVPNLLARSKPMTLTMLDDNGKPYEQEGTFMMKADGVDLNNALTGTGKLSADSLKNTDGKAIQQLADLQVLDFICGNVDRHMGNIFYQIDKSGKLTGIVGIDNDCSFGEFVPKGGESRRRLAGLDNMRVMSESMANKVLAMKAPTLKYALRGYGLTEKQLDAACKRLELTKKAIEKSLNNPVVGEKNGRPTFEKGKIRILKDSEFKKVDLKDLAVNTDKQGREVSNGKEFGNIFSCAYTGITDTANRQNSYGGYVMKADRLLNTENRCRVPGLEQAVNAAKTLKNSLGSVSYWRSSGNYRDMQRAAKELYNYQDKILRRIRLSTGKEITSLKDYSEYMNAVVKPKEVEKMANLAKKLENAANTYLQGKGITNHQHAIGDYSTYTQARIENATEVLNVAKSFSQLKPEEKDLAQVSERQAKEAMARVQGNKKDPVTRNEAQNLQELPKALQPIK